VGRPSGTRSKTHDARRREITARLTERLALPGAMHASYRDLVAASGESISTLQHYFGRRENILLAVLEESRSQADPYLDYARTPLSDFHASVRDVVDHLRVGYEQFGLGDIFAIGFVEGIRNAAIGPSMVHQLLEPAIDAVAQRLSIHQSRGDMRDDVLARHAAVLLLSPVIVIMLHQRDLGGRQSHPADMDRFIDDHVASFVRAHAAAGI
jgi:AcrR family transcriptional regulator